MKPVPERIAAQAAGERYFCTGAPCRAGHVSKRSTASGSCCECRVVAVLKYQAKAPEHPARAAAREAGHRHYARGEPCVHGHEDKWFTSTGACVRCSIKRCKAWNGRNPGRMAQDARRRRAADPSGHRAEVKRWAQANKDRVREALKAWKAVNIEHVRAYSRAYVNARNARKRGNGGTFTEEDVLHLRASQGGLCAACHRGGIKLEVDHIVSVVKGGYNGVPNIQLLCRSCNASKRDRDFAEWMEEKGYITLASVESS